MNPATSWRSDADKAATMLHLAAVSEDADLIAELIERAQALLETVQAKHEIADKLARPSEWRTA
jgi:hypothetical protein